MNTNNPNIKWHIPIEKIWTYFEEHKEELTESMHIVCEYIFDDMDKKWWLYVTTNFDDSDNMILSLENSDVIIDSAVLSGPENIKETVESLLAEL